MLAKQNQYKTSNELEIIPSNSSKGSTGRKNNSQMNYEQDSLVSVTPRTNEAKNRREDGIINTITEISIKKSNDPSKLQTLNQYLDQSVITLPKIRMQHELNEDSALNTRRS